MLEVRQPLRVPYHTAHRPLFLGLEALQQVESRQQLDGAHRAEPRQQQQRRDDRAGNAPQVGQEVRGAADRALTAWRLVQKFRDQSIPLAQSNLELSRENGQQFPARL